MNEWKLYSTLPELKAPWKVDRISLDSEKKTIEVHTAHEKGSKLICPTCGKECMVYDHLKNILNYFTHKITNARAEGINSKIALIEKMAYGYRNRERLKTVIYFRCGNLWLYPETHMKV